MIQMRMHKFFLQFFFQWIYKRGCQKWTYLCPHFLSSVLNKCFCVLIFDYPYCGKEEMRKNLSSTKFIARLTCFPFCTVQRNGWSINLPHFLNWSCFYRTHDHGNAMEFIGQRSWAHFGDGSKQGVSAQLWLPNGLNTNSCPLWTNGDKFFSPLFVCRDSTSHSGSVNNNEKICQSTKQCCWSLLC